MGEYADEIVDRWIDSWQITPRRRQPANWQTGTGRFSWRDGEGNVLDMRKMSTEHLRNALAVCGEKNNPGKAADLRAVLKERAAAEFGPVDIEE